MNPILPTLVQFVEGTLLPSREGATRRFLGTARNLNQIGHRVIVVHCYRGWSDLRLIDAEPFTTYAMTPDIFYGDGLKIADIVASEGAAIAQFSELQTLCSLGIPLKRLIPSIRLSYECHDVHSEFLSSLGAPTSNVERVSVMERYALPQCDLILCFTQEDKDALRQRGADHERLFVVPFGIERATVDNPHPYSSAGREIVFLGNMYHRPNQAALTFIVQKLVPALRELDVKCRFTIVGDCPALLQEALSHADVTFVGAVERLSPLLSRMTVAVAPITEGSGIKVKMLDYFYAGLPTIGTSLAFRGYSRSAGVVIDHLPKLPSAVAALLDDKGWRDQLSKQAISAAEANDWKTIRHQLSHLYTAAVLCPLVTRYYRDDDAAPATGIPYVLEDNVTQNRFQNSGYPALTAGSILRLGGRSGE